jgi:hypothetical protein
MTQEPASGVAVNRVKASVWLAWLILATVVTARYFRWEVSYFSSPGAIFRTLLLAALPLAAVACAAYLWLRRKRLWRYEIPVLSAFCGLCLVLYQPVAVLVTAALFLACLASGCRFARLFRVPLATPADVLTLAFGLGSALLIPILFVLGLSRLYYAPVFILLLAAPCLVFRTEVVVGVQAVRQIVTGTAGSAHPMAGIAFVFAIFAAGSTVAVSLAPSIAYDPLAMHLALARFYAEQHVLAVVPSLDYSYYPQGSETLMALAWSLGGQPAAQLISPLFWVLSLALLFLIARACGLNKVAAFAGVIAAAMLPFAHWSGANAKNDSAMVFFQAAALLAFIRWLETRNRVWIPIGALFLGSTFAIKHVALFGAIPLVCFFLYASYYTSHQTTQRLRVALLFSVILAASALYWHARTAYLTGNPVYPAALSQSWKQGVPKAAGQSRLTRFWRVPWRVQFDGMRAFESPLPNPMGFALLVFLPLAILVGGPRTRARRACLLFCGIYVAYWLATIGTLRYAILPISLLVVLLAGKATTFYDGLGSRYLRASVAAALAGVLLFAVLGIAIIEVNAPMLLLFARHIGGEQYLDMALRTHKSLAWLTAAHPQSNIDGIGNCSRTYAPDPGKYYCSSGQWDKAERVLATCRCEYVVMPRERKPGRDAEPVFSDAFYTVWQFK